MLLALDRFNKSIVKTYFSWVGKRGEGIYRGIATFVEQQAYILESPLRDQLQERH